MAMETPPTIQFRTERCTAAASVGSCSWGDARNEILIAEMIAMMLLWLPPRSAFTRMKANTALRRVETKLAARWRCSTVALPETAETSSAAMGNNNPTSGLLLSAPVNPRAIIGHARADSTFTTRCWYTTSLRMATSVTTRVVTRMSNGKIHVSI